MKLYIYPLLITLLGLSAAYLFYAMWHTEVLNPKKVLEKQQEKTAEELPDKVSTSKALAHSQTNTPEQSTKKIQIEKDDEIKQESEIPNLTPQEMQAKTEALYNELKPEEQEETMQEAQTAFEELDITVEAQDAKLAEEMQADEESQDVLAVDTAEEEIPEEEQADITVLENEKEVDMENEDINNL